MRGELGRSLVRVVDCFSRANSSNRQSYHLFFTQREILREIEFVVFWCCFCCVWKYAGWESKCYSLDSREGGMQENCPTWDTTSFSFFFWFVSLFVLEPGACASRVRHCTQFTGRWYKAADWFSRIDSTIIKSGPFSPPPPKNNNNNTQQQQQQTIIKPVKVLDSVCIRRTWQRLLHHHAVAMEPREFASRIR